MLPILGATIVGGIVGSLTSDDSKSASLISSAKRYEEAADNLMQVNSELQRTLNKAIKVKVDEEEKRLALKYAKQLAKEQELERIINEQLIIYKETTDIEEKKKLESIILTLQNQIK